VYSDRSAISIPEDKWDEFANDFSVQVYNNKADYRKNSLIIWFSSFTWFSSIRESARFCACTFSILSENSLIGLSASVDTRGDDQSDDAEEIYISIPEDKWDEFANDFSDRSECMPTYKIGCHSTQKSQYC